MEKTRNHFVYQGEKTREISFPLGGIGTGCIGLGGNGRLTDWEIFNRPNKGGANGYSHIAVKAAADGELLSAKALNGDLCGEFSGPRGLSFGHGVMRDTAAGFPHFRGHTFTGEFPIARVDFADSDFPGKASLTAFNPFIPLDEDASSLPAAFFAVTLQNTTARAIDYTVAFSVQNPFDEPGRNRQIAGDGFCGLAFTQENHAPDELGFGNLTLATDAADAAVQEAWYRGLWFDGPTVFWHDFAAAAPLPARSYPDAGVKDTGTVAVTFSLAPGEAKTVRFLLAWHVPHCVNDWNPPPAGENARWRNHYATRFASSEETARYALRHWDSLYRRTLAFKEALFSSTLPDEVIDAVSANLSILKSPTVLRLEDGSFYGWEGTNEHTGSCEGSCTHVWNYAYALPFLFPRLERSMRELDYRYNQWESGRMSFRLQLPAGRAPNTFLPCVDGQMGGVIKFYRDWKLCGDDEWLRRWWPSVKKALEFAWSPENDCRWDADQDGVLEGRQHQTLDMELFGPSSWLESFYLAALKAGAEMADRMGDTDAAALYRRLFDQGRAWSEAHLFNGAYFVQRVDLHDKAILAPYGDIEAPYWNAEAGELKYQIGEGCFIDQLCGQWHASLAGLGHLFDEKKIRTALRSLYRYNFKREMRRECNPCRLYCLNDEGGAILCEYPAGAEKPVVSVPYAQECFSGCEYEAAALLISEGMSDEGLDLVRAVRDRYDGAKRNPWNELECGGNYARSMASYSLIPVYSGFCFDMAAGRIGFCPVRKPGERFRTLWSVDSAWGTVEMDDGELLIRIEEGTLPLRALTLPFLPEGAAPAVEIDGQSAAAVRQGDDLVLGAPAAVRGEVRVRYAPDGGAA